MQTVIPPSPETTNLSQILSLEDDPILLAFHCPNTTIPVWALIRVTFIRTIMSELLYKNTSLTTGPRQRQYKQALQYGLRSLVHNSYHRNDYTSDICLFSSGFGNFTRNSHTFERLVGYFANTYPDKSLIYQGHGDLRWHSNHQFPRVLYAAPSTLYTQVVGRIRLNGAHLRLAAAVLERAAANAFELLGHVVQPRDMAVLKRSLAQQLAAMPFTTDYYAGWFSCRKIRLLLKEDGCFGARSIAILAAAKLAGVATAEYQHGALSAGHDGYNVAPALEHSLEFKRTLPDYLLTWGEWWGEQINMPLRRIVIGNPHFTESTKHISTTKTTRECILILGDGIETELYLDLAKNVAKAANVRGVRVLFRPHPFERLRTERAAIPVGVEVDKNSDIYQSFAVASIVISELSTGLFEAANLVDRVIMWNTQKARFAFPKLPFPSFSSFTELEDMLFQKPNFYSDVEGSSTRSKIWDNNWKLNYKNFVESILLK